MSDHHFRPFENDTQMQTFSDGSTELYIENAQDFVYVSGELELAPTRAGLAQARALQEAFRRIADAIEAQLGSTTGDA